MPDSPRQLRSSNKKNEKKESSKKKYCDEKLNKRPEVRLEKVLEKGKKCFLNIY